MDVAVLFQHVQYAVPVSIVLVCAILVFVFGFKNAEQPPFAQLSTVSDVDRKLAGKKRSKIREKRAANGQVPAEKASPAKKTSPAKTEPAKKSVAKAEEVDGKLKERKQEDNKPAAVKKEKTQTVVKSGKENKIEQVKNKKNLKNLNQEKPVDYDEGDWEQAYSRKDKKNKKKEEETPSKKNKKATKKADIINELVAKDEDQEKPGIKDKVAKETENKELKEKDKKEVILAPISGDAVSEEKPAEEDETANKALQAESEVKVDEKKSGKAKKAKKISENETTPTVSQPPTPKIDHKPVDDVVEKKVENFKKKVEETETLNVEKAEEKSPVVFDELGDVWTEAKPQKKSKKKARKDN